MCKERTFYHLWHVGGDQNNLKGLNELLGSGWVPVRETPMHGPRTSWLSSLVLLEREALSVTVQELK